MKKHPAYCYCKDVLNGKIPAPKYVKLQCQEFMVIADDKHKLYMIDTEKVQLIDSFTQEILTQF